jgi:predicted RNA-binding protein with PIN domain
MPILIDGHNLIGRLGISLRDPNDEDELLQILIPYRARTGKPVTVVFDPGVATAMPRRRRRGGIDVGLAPLGGRADATIVQRVRRSRNPQEWLVVTSDQALRAAVTQLGARVRSAEAFAAALVASRTMVEGPSRAKERPPSPEEVEAWLALFEADG